MNARPLTFVGDDFDSQGPLTPSHFLLGRDSPQSRLTLPTFDLSNLDHERLIKLLEQKGATTQQFWVVWKDEYLRNLPPYKGKRREKELRVGQIVLVEGEGSRLEWPLGVVESIHQGRDGLIRAVTLKTAKGLISRPIQRLHDLEIFSSMPLPEPEEYSLSHSHTQNIPLPVPSDNEDEAIGTQEARTETVPTTTRSGRAVKRLRQPGFIYDPYDSD